MIKLLFLTGALLFISTFILDYDDKSSLVIIVFSIIMMVPFTLEKEKQPTSKKPLSIDQINKKLDDAERGLESLRKNVDADKREIEDGDYLQGVEDSHPWKDRFDIEREREELKELKPDIELIDSIQVKNDEDALERLRLVHKVNSKIFYYYSAFLRLDSVGTGQFNVEKVSKFNARFKSTQRENIDIKSMSEFDGHIDTIESEVLFGFIDSKRNYEIIVSESELFSSANNMMHFTVLQDDSCIYQISTRKVDYDFDECVGSFKNPCFNSSKATIGKSLNWFQSVYDFLQTDELLQIEGEKIVEDKKRDSIASLNR